MTHERKVFRGRLLDNEIWDSPARERYEQTVRELVSRKLTTLQRWTLRLVAVVLASASLLFIALAVSQSQLPMLARIFFVEATVVAAALIGYAVHVLKRGEFHRRGVPTFFASIMWVFAVLLSMHFVALIPSVTNPSIAIHLLGLSMIAMLGAGLQLLRVCIERSELNTHERMLEMLYRLSEGESRAQEPRP